MDSRSDVGIGVVLSGGVILEETGNVRRGTVRLKSEECVGVVCDYNGCDGPEHCRFGVDVKLARLLGDRSMRSMNRVLAVAARTALIVLAGAALVAIPCSARVRAGLFAEVTAPQQTSSQTPGQTPLTQKVGAVKSINGNALVLTVDGGTDVSVTVASDAKIVQVAPGEKDLRSATPIALTDLQVGDRVLVRGRASDDAKTMAAVGIIAMKRTDLEAKKAQDRDDWQKRGIGGLVSAVDPATGTITISTGTGATAKTVAIHTAKNTVLRRYAPDSVQFDDAKPAALDQIKPGDQVRARGTKSADGSEFAADEIVSGTFRNLAGIITAIDASAQTISLTDLISKKTVVVKITQQSQLRKIPAQMAQMIAFRLKGAGAGAGAQGGGSAGAGAASAQGDAAAGGNGPPNGGQRSGGAGATGNGASGNVASGGGRGDFQQIVNRLPASTLADFQRGDAVMVVSTQGTDAGGVTAITMLGGVESILAAAPAGNAAQAMTLSPWSLGGGAPTGDASGGNQ